jgi:hypothetical protein
MRRFLVSFALANLSLLSSYAIVATWPDRAPPVGPDVATVTVTTQKLAAVASVRAQPVSTRVVIAGN